MPLLFSNPAFNEDLVRALSRTLVHSLWQGMLLAMVAGAIVFFTKKTSPAIRYNLLAGALFIFTAGIIATFSMLAFTGASQEIADSTKAIQAPGNPETAFATLFADKKLPLPARAVQLFNSNANWIVLGWLLVILLRCVHLSFGIYGVYQLRRRQTFSAGEFWNNRLAELGRQLQMNKKVQLVQSGIAKVPAVIGYFKPVILFPAGMLVSLSPAEVEAVLIHELAHIRRKDFLVNILQHLVEIIFFFNPAVKWVSSLVRLERENCCDEIAVNHTDSKRNYINALIAFQGFDLQLTPTLANAFAVERNHLMNRVIRIIYNNNKTLNNMEKKLLAAGMVITSVFIFAFSSNNLQQIGSDRNGSSRYEQIAAPGKIGPVITTSIDTVPVRSDASREQLNGTINNTVKGRKYKIVVENDRLVELYVDGKKIPAENIATYKSVTDKILAQSKSDMVQSKLEMLQSKKEMEQAHREMREFKTGQEESEKEMAHAKMEMGKHRAAMAEEIEQVNKEIVQIQKEMEQEQNKTSHEAEKVRNEQLEITVEQSKRQIEQVKLEMEHATKEMAENMEQLKIEMEQAKQHMQRAQKDMQQSHKEMDQSKNLQERLIKDLIQENIIKDKSDLTSVRLNNEELVVNGVKQPGAIHKKFKNKYVKGNNWSMEHHYNYSRDVK